MHDARRNPHFYVDFFVKATLAPFFPLVQGHRSLRLCSKAIKENWSSYVVYMYTQVFSMVNDYISYCAKHK